MTLPLALADLRLIDEYEFLVKPVLAGHGPTLLAGLGARIQLELGGTPRGDTKARVQVCSVLAVPPNARTLRVLGRTETSLLLFRDVLRYGAASCPLCGSNIRRVRQPDRRKTALRKSR